MLASACARVRLLICMRILSKTSTWCCFVVWTAAVVPSGNGLKIVVSASLIKRRGDFLPQHSLCVARRDYCDDFCSLVGRCVEVVVRGALGR
jgi:hypothetical protein